MRLRPLAVGGHHTASQQVTPTAHLRAARRTWRLVDIAELDKLMGGGVDSGSSTLIIGPAGTGKSLLVLQFVTAAVKRGEHAALFIFYEELGLLFSRSKAMGIDLESMRDAGMLHIVQVDAAEISPGEFAHKVRKVVEKDNIRTVVIDSLNGYQNAMPQEQYLILPRRRCDISYRCPARNGWSNEITSGRHVSRRHGHFASLF